MTSGPAPDPRIAVVIPVLDSAATLGDCLASVTASGAVAASDVLVVDNGSADGSPEVAASAGVRVLRCARRGPGAARNVALDAIDGAGHAFVAFIDADAVLEGDWLARGAAFLVREKGHGGVGGVARSFGHSLAERALDASLWGAGSATAGVREVDTLATMNAMFRAEAISGLRFDERLIAGEDPEFSFAVRDRGWLLGLDSALHVRHHNPERVSALYRKWFAYGRYYLAPYLLHPRRFTPLVLARVLAIPVLLVVAAAGMLLGSAWMGPALAVSLLLAGYGLLVARMRPAAAGSTEAPLLAAVHLGKACVHNLGIWAGAWRLWGLAASRGGQVRS